MEIDVCSQEDGRLSQSIPMFRVHKPCGNCPFRQKGAIDLAPGRLEQIIGDLVKNDWRTFQCHKTLDAKDGPSMCAGAAIYLTKIGRPNVAMRLGMAMGVLDLPALAEQGSCVIEPLT